MLSRLGDVAELEVRNRQPEMKLVVLAGAADLAGEQVACRRIVALGHRGDAEIEEMERRIRLDLRELAQRSVCVGHTPLLLQHLRMIRQGRRILRLPIEDRAEDLVCLSQVTVSQIYYT